MDSNKYIKVIIFIGISVTISAIVIYLSTFIQIYAEDNYYEITSIIPFFEMLVIGFVVIFISSLIIVNLQFR